MKSTTQLTLSFPDAATARTIEAAVSVDDQAYVKTTRRGRTVVAEATAEGPMQLLHTLDDYLACVSVAERTAREARPRGRARRARG
jgi:hypothetical protein